MTRISCSWKVIVVLFAGLLLGSSQLKAQSSTSAQEPPYLNPALPVEQRVNDLISRMTLEEKASQLVNQARAIPRLKIPAYDWWSESLHGVMVNGTTEFPEPIGLAATFDAPGIHHMAIAISTEARIKHDQDVRAGHSDIFEGLDFWAPNINIFRDPRWGRGQETYGEDPFLTAHMGVAFVTGMQGDNPKYYRTISTPKHYAVHSGPESTRHSADVPVSKHDMLDTYLPAFRATVTQGKAGSVMCAYNSINGEPACANEFLLVDQLRDKWAFQGYVVSDCGAVRDIFNGHRFEPSQPQASAISLKRGMDNECIDFVAKVKDDHDYAPYIEAVKEGYLKESEIDIALKRLFTARIKLGMFDPPAMDPYSNIDEKLLDSPQHRAMALKLANESMVLLKNDGTLPLGTSGTKIAVVGPLAEQTRYLLGNYTGIPTHIVSVAEGMRAEFPKAQLQFVSGTNFLSKDASPVPTDLLTVDGKPGVRATYYSQGDMLALLGERKLPNPIVSRVEPGIGMASSLPSEVSGTPLLIVSWQATFTPKETGEYNFGITGQGFMRVSLDDKTVAMAFHTNGVETKLGRANLEAGHAYSIRVEYGLGNGVNEHPKLVWAKRETQPSPEAIAAANNSDVIVAVVGITSELEGEEMAVSEDGFKGGDRTSIDLPKPEEDLLKALASTGKPLVVVLMNGSALSVNWAKEHANAVLEAWYPGEEGGAAVAQTLAGVNNPGGRLPVTFYTGVEQLPPFDDYNMANRTYRYFSGTPLFPFGYGLSYSKFTYSNAKLSAEKLTAGEPLTIEADVKNISDRDGDEVVQAYLTFPKVSGVPLRALRGFERVHIAAGKTEHVSLTLQPRDLSHVSDESKILISPGSYTLSIGGGQPGTSEPVAGTSFVISGEKELSE
ncbi:MAG TPA: glycoside hydrolase family 3 C-terminal domain-containing protein [Candidatus Eisenbacteria bacterium]|nr:glycoside hydrolase family 3 C-terminal domain-containing protein [Candidatus Eisenbacteria bacterium]